ncbi:helix-turn-helix domain-containing protein [Rhodospirillum rubrum]|uniref:Transcriptional regulator, XRE family n=1 Tax=Rhodospirillum rubrum (strain ATCC 11170 / ATH 1.1.1 / DSM 467 / LMG 4362 / NCIMB 8255 / S1) TaxID=269796 RepID=Q2RMK8_RHORT|nr:helix-turn-helix transcriptional regulator [Rhodospirillum rubrum]ABC24637.1 transcriptional regulator, XRE family [Rhodospirillum rubrum ATCC 11170]QXG82485.1 helix-turn-helix domain-containing protein [Rhodospirillum rubrum]
MYSHPQQGGGPEALKLRQEAGRWLKTMRETHGISQRELAKRISVDYYTFISQVEAGRGRVPPDRYESWAKALNLDVIPFVKKMMSFYDPVTYDILFGRIDHQR